MKSPRIFTFGRIFVISFLLALALLPTGQAQQQGTEKDLTFVGTIKQPSILGTQPLKSLSLDLLEMPQNTFVMDIPNAIKYGLAAWIPGLGNPKMGIVGLVDSRGWKVKLLCQKRSDTWYNIISFERMEPSELPSPSIVGPFIMYPKE